MLIMIHESFINTLLTEQGFCTLFQVALSKNLICKTCFVNYYIHIEKDFKERQTKNHIKCVYNTLITSLSCISLHISYQSGGLHQY